jgi:hypothetical protein
MMILMSHKVRSRMPEVPPEPESESCAEKPARRGRPPGTVNEAAPVKLLREDLGSIKLGAFKNVPVDLLNRIASTFCDSIGKQIRILDASYRDGIDARLSDLIEHVIPEIVYDLGRNLMTQVLLQQRGFLGTNLRCHHDGCEGPLEYQGDVEKEIKTKLGPVSLRRAYYHGPCGHSACPLDIQLGIDGTHAALPGYQEAVAMLGASVSYPEAVRLIGALLPGKLSLKCAEAVTATIAADVQARQQAEVDAVMVDPSKAAAGSATVEGVAVVSCDGGFIKARDHVEKTREFKLGVIGSIGPRPHIDAEQPSPANGCQPAVRLEDKRYVGRMAGPDIFFDQVEAEYYRSGFHRFKVLHGVADGADWILTRIADLAQQGQEVSTVLDWYHAAERVAAVANIVHGLTAKGR